MSEFNQLCVLRGTIMPEGGAEELEKFFKEQICEIGLSSMVNAVCTILLLVYEKVVRKVSRNSFI